MKKETFKNEKAEVVSLDQLQEVARPSRRGMIDLDSELLRRGGGFTWWLAAPKRPRHQVVHILFRLNKLIFKQGLVFFGCKVVFLTQSAECLGLSDEALNQWLAAQCPVSVWNSHSPVYLFSVWHKQDALHINGERGDIHQRAIFSLPNAMKLRFEPNPRNFANSPAKVLLATVSSNVLFNDQETLVEWLIREGIVFDVNSGTATKGITE